MQLTNPPLPQGYSPVPPGKLANVVTCLEMRERPPRKPARPTEQPLTVERWQQPGLEDYRALFRLVGEDWMWTSRLLMADETLAAILADPQVEVYRLHEGRRVLGLLELDFRQAGECELAFFGLVREAIGQGAGRFLMEQAIARAWSRPIGRLWVHTCSFDHPGAPAFYRRSGFTPYALMVEVHDDPRHSGHLPTTAAPHVPFIPPQPSKG
ncbi:GNAT family N-acetyltransferase [Labrys wisconsinensis]|uniref:GNAT superfamily N-acetyltransferase n=1 Tax=Labrys wisconsinensis TaxID=425677 RepID=A0ABU0JCU4_9HYPH|nr:GNAT family N-acetyltransferase [Labrys wisconsinensis]MDQ0471331.1 GNAT superfamily N-acetyltransferase [Labrys wisconsinensis]